MATERGTYQIGRVATSSSVSAYTIRYYEKLGLLSKPIRSNGGFRMYSEETIEKLRFIKKAQEFGFTLAEIRKIMQESEKGLKNCCHYVGKLFRKKLEELELKIKELQQMRNSLSSLLSEWVPTRQAKKLKYTVCPQIEREPKKKRKVLVR